VSGTATGLQVSVERLSQPGVSFVNQAVTLQPEWQEMHVDFDAKDAEKDGAPAAGAVRLKFDAAQATVLLDDVSLECVDGDATNMTAFRDEVVQALRELRPGVLRDMQALTLGDSVKNLLAEPMARQREGYSAWRTEATDTGYGLPEFLQLCAAVKADPWITMPATMSAREVKDLMDYLTTPVKGRAAWSAQFGVIHLEFGNETWNTIFRGASMEYPEDYGHRASVIFSAVRASKGYSAKRFDLLAGGQTGWVGRTQEILKHTEGADSLAMAPYLMHDVGEHADTAAIFGALLAEPEMFVRNGMVAQNMAAAADRKQPMAASIYEENLHSTEGTATQETLDALTPSAGAGVAMASLMMQAMRAGVKTQQLFTLGQYEFQRKDRLQVKLWGTVVDMGVTNRRRPQFLAAKLLNEAVGGAMMTTAQTGADPTWDEDSGIDGVKVDGAHELQSFAFKDGARRALVLINVSRDAALAVDFNGAVRPHGRVDMDQMRAAKITDTNEDAERVKIIHGVVPVFDAEQKLTLPACSVMVLKWSE